VTAATRKRSSRSSMSIKTRKINRPHKYDKNRSPFPVPRWQGIGFSIRGPRFPGKGCVTIYFPAPFQSWGLIANGKRGTENYLAPRLPSRQVDLFYQRLCPFVVGFGMFCQSGSLLQNHFFRRFRRMLFSSGLDSVNLAWFRN
jgi:hypothetical protein